jgi:hypothetical protein
MKDEKKDDLLLCGSSFYFSLITYYSLPILQRLFQRCPQPFDSLADMLWV